MNSFPLKFLQFSFNFPNKKVQSDSQTICIGSGFNVGDVRKMLREEVRAGKIPKEEIGVGNPDEISDAELSETPCEGRYNVYVFWATSAWIFLTVMIGVLDLAHGRDRGWLWLILGAWGICVSSGLITLYL